MKRLLEKKTCRNQDVLEQARQNVILPKKIIHHSKAKKRLPCIYAKYNIALKYTRLNLNAFFKQITYVPIQIVYIFFKPV